MVIRKIRKKEKMKTYYKITKDITLVDGENLSELNEGDIVFSYFHFPSDKIEKCAVLNKNIHLSIGLVKKNPEIFQEITEDEFNIKCETEKIKSILLQLPVEERKEIVMSLYKEFIPQILFIPPSSPMPTPFNPYKDVIGGCSVCGNSIGTPCWSTNCPNRIQIWYSSSSDIK